MKPNDETDNATEHNMVKTPNWQESDQLAIYNNKRGPELNYRVHRETTPAKWSKRDFNF